MPCIDCVDGRGRIAELRARHLAGGPGAADMRLQRAATGGRAADPQGPDTLHVPRCARDEALGRSGGPCTGCRSTGSAAPSTVAATALSQCCGAQGRAYRWFWTRHSRRPSLRAGEGQAAHTRGDAFTRPGCHANAKLCLDAHPRLRPDTRTEGMEPSAQLQCRVAEASTPRRSCCCAALALGAPGTRCTAMLLCIVPLACTGCQALWRAGCASRTLAW
mmetsp:Transcript_57564/g.184809  ORF Transcript_57564/g.184809 Transcript_57564/m.184809 type:complete len:219 (-) Transcript_57564:1172-1828(-)